MGIITEHKLPKRMTSSRSLSLDTTSFFSSSSSLGTGTGSSTETVTKLSDMEVIFGSEGTIGSTVIAITGSLSGFTER